MSVIRIRDTSSNRCTNLFSIASRNSAFAPSVNVLGFAISGDSFMTT
jgi:hypothetical protein